MADHLPHWAYTGLDGASHWSGLDPSFKACDSGKSQSPINIDKTVKTDLPKLQFHYASAAPTIVNNGHTIQVNLPAGSNLVVGDRTLQLLQFHLHTPSEETVHGKHTAMVAHFVHRDAANKLGVVAVLIEPGAKNEAFDPIFLHMPRPGEAITVDEMSINLAALLPYKLAYYGFEGSLTTPPCSEGVSWMVLKEPITLSARQIETFRHSFPRNARPVQPLNDRVVNESD